MARAALLRVPDVAARLGVCPRTVERLIARGDLGYCRIGRLVMVPEGEIEAYLRRVYRPPERG